LNQGAARDRVPHAVADVGPSVSRFEQVLVYPEPVRSAVLPIDKPVGRLPYGNLTLPENREPVKPYPVIDAGSRFHLNRPGREKFKTQQGGCQGLQVVRVGEKVKDFLERSWQPQLGL